MNLIKDSMQNFAVNQALNYIEGNPEENIPKLMDLVDRFTPEGWYQSQRDTIRKVIDEKNNWYQLILRVYELDPGVRRAFFQNFLFNASLKGSATQEETSAKENCNVPWAILLDPTSACNMHCTGCWAAEYGNQLNLSLETIDSIICQGKKLGTYMYIYTGGEPLVRKADLIKICQMHPDCEFLSFTNGTLIDEDFCQEMLKVKNFVPAISLEGFEEANDSRRGTGAYQKVQKAMELLKNIICRSVSPPVIPAIIMPMLQVRNFSTISSTVVRCLFGSSITCRSETMQLWNCFHLLNRGRKYTIVFVLSVKQKQFSPWISKMMLSMWEDVLPVVAAISISMQKVM